MDKYWQECFQKLGSLKSTHQEITWNGSAVKPVLTSLLLLFVVVQTGCIADRGDSVSGTDLKKEQVADTGPMDGRDRDTGPDVAQTDVSSPPDERGIDAGSDVAQPDVACVDAFDATKVEVGEVEIVDVQVDEQVPEPTELGKSCTTDLDCATDAGCLLGFCTHLCKEGGELLDGVCGNPYPDSEWGTLFECPLDMDVCMPGAVGGKLLTCSVDSDCAAEGLPDFVCGGTFPHTEIEVAGRCLPLGNRKPLGATCLDDSSICGSLTCLHPNMDESPNGICTAYCDESTNCPAGSVCAMYPASEGDSQDVMGYAPFCVPLKGSLDECTTLADCEAIGKEYCGAIFQPGAYEPRFICLDTDNPSGGWLGDYCSQEAPCFGPWCIFGPWANKVAAYCSQACKTDDQCSDDMECRTVHVVPFGGVLPSGEFEIGVCLKVAQGSPCFIGEEGVCAYDWSFCELIPGGAWIGNCMDGECPIDCEGKACKAEDGCGGECEAMCLANGQVCADGTECLSALCVDDVCCEGLCDGTCETCNHPDFLGTCIPFQVGSDPDGECEICHACDGASACAPVLAGDDPEDACGTCQVCGDEGACVPVEMGTDPDLECGMCKVCDGEGACGPVDYGIDPKEDCDETESAFCLTTGICNGEGACEIWAEGTICSEAKCQGFMYIPQSICNGKGVCAPHPAVQCAPYTCNEEAVQCNTDCQDTAECSTNYWCLDDECQANPQCPVKTKLICNAQVPGSTLGHQNDWTNYGCAPMVPYIGPDRIYSLTMENDTKITVSLQEAEFDSALMLLQHACDPENACQAYADSFNAGGEETLEFIAIGGVDYHLAVDGFSKEDKGDYKITVDCCEMSCAKEDACGDDGCGGSCGTCGDAELCVQGVCHVCADDPGGEPNDTCMEAIAAIPGLMEGNLLCPPGDIDWYEFELLEGESITFQAEIVGEGVDLDLALHGPGCDVFVADATTELEEGEMLEYLVLEAGAYYLLVYPPYMAETGYELEVTIKAPQCMSNSDCFGGKVCGLYKCVLPPKPCEAVSQPGCGAFIAGDTTGKPTNHTDYTTCTAVSFEAPEDVYSMTFEEETVVTVSLSGHTFYAGLAVLEDYCASSWACVTLGDGWAPGGGVQAVFKAKPGKLYYLLVDGKAEEDMGNYAFDVACCTPQCEGKVCGDDGCGMDCGTCPGEADACIEGECICQPSCSGKECGDDGCGQVCGECAGEQVACEDGVCVCHPSCNGKECGDDGCGGICAICKGPQEACIGFKCECQPACQGMECGDDGCGQVCGECPITDPCVEGNCECLNDSGLEPNDTCGKASLLTPGSYPDLTICKGGDADWYSIQLQPNDTLEVTADFVHADGDLDLYLYKAGNCVGYLDSSSTSTDNEFVEHKSDMQSGYLVRVIGYDASVSNFYALEVSVK